MAGGVFNNARGKVRPGVYVNLKSNGGTGDVSSRRGVGIIPLIGYDWGPRGTFIRLTADSPDAHKAELGRSVYDNNSAMRMLQLMLQGAYTVYAYIPDSGAKATKAVTIGEDKTLTITAKYKGTLGNKIKVVSVANPVSGFDVSVFVDNVEVEAFEKLATVGDLAGISEYVDFTGTATDDLIAISGATLENGTDTASGNTGVTDFLDKSEKIRFNCMCFPSTDSALQTALLTKIRYIRETLGWKCQAVAPDFAADYEGIINLTNSFVFGETTLTTAEACAWLAGATAGADYTTSLTYAVVPGATMVSNELSNEQAIAAINAGKAFFSVSENGEVILEYDINSLVTITTDTPADLNRNRQLRVYDSWCNDCLTTFIPGAYRNDEEGWIVIEGMGRAMLKAYEAAGAITNVDLEADFVVDQERSVGDSIYITAGIQPADSADKYYITTIAR